MFFPRGSLNALIGRGVKILEKIREIFPKLTSFLKMLFSCLGKQPIQTLKESQRMQES